MKATSISGLVALALLTTTAQQTLSQSTVAERKPPAVYAGTNFSMACGSIEQTGSVVRCEGGRTMEFRMWDVKNPAHVTLIEATTIKYDLVTGEVRAEGDVRVTVENVPNRQVHSNRTLILPTPVNR